MRPCISALVWKEDPKEPSKESSSSDEEDYKDPYPIPTVGYPAQVAADAHQGQPVTYTCQGL